MHVTGDHAEIEEVAEVYRLDPLLPLYLLTGLEAGAVEVCRADSYRTEVAPTLDAALALVEHVERS